VEGNWNRPPTNFGLKVALVSTLVILKYDLKNLKAKYFH